MSAVLILGAMACAGAALLALPLILRRRRTAARGEFDQAVYRDQLEELDRDAARGVISETDAEAARREISRRLIAAAHEGQESAPQAPRTAASAGGRGTITAIAVLAPLAAGAIYWALGSPDLPGQPFAARTPASPGPTTAQIGRMVEMLERRLAENPDEIQGWIILTTAYLRMGRPEDAEKALARAITLAGEDKARASMIAANFGEALVAISGGQVTPRAKAAFERALELLPTHPMAGYYLGLARLQAGDAEAALTVWRRIVAKAPKDAPWRAELQNRIEKLAAERGLEKDAAP